VKDGNGALEEEEEEEQEQEEKKEKEKKRKVQWSTIQYKRLSQCSSYIKNERDERFHRWWS